MISLDSEEREASKAFKVTPEWFRWVLGEKNLYPSFLQFIHQDKIALDQVLFYEASEFFDELLQEELPEAKRYRHSHSSLDTFVQSYPETPFEESRCDILIPHHLNHHAKRIYDFYFSSQAPLSFQFPMHLSVPIHEYIRLEKIPITWLDHAVQYTLHGLYTTSFPPFVAAIRDIVDDDHTYLASSDIFEKQESMHTLKSTKSRYLRRLYSSVSSKDSQMTLNIIQLVQRKLRGVCSDESVQSHDILDYYSSSKISSSPSLKSFGGSSAESVEILDRLLEEYLHASNGLDPRQNAPRDVPLTPLTRSLYFDYGGLYILENNNQNKSFENSRSDHVR